MSSKKCPACGWERDFEYLGKRTLQDGLHAEYRWKCCKCGHEFKEVERIIGRVRRAPFPESLGDMYGYK